MWTGVGDGVGDTPQTAMTTRAPAVLIMITFKIMNVEYIGLTSLNTM